MRKIRDRGFDRIGPIVSLIVVVDPESATRNTNFSQMALRTSSLSSASMPPRRQKSSSVSARGEREPSYSPKISRCIVPVCLMTPGRSMFVAM